MHAESEGTHVGDPHAILSNAYYKGLTIYCEGET